LEPLETTQNIHFFIIHFTYNMKGTFFNLKLRSLVAMFFLLGGLFFATNSAKAQSFNWLGETQAVTQLSADIDQMSLDIQNFVPGSSQYKNLQNHIYYYKLVMVTIEGGTTVEVSVNEQLGHVNDQFNEANKFLSKTTLVGLYNDIVLILTN